MSLAADPKSISNVPTSVVISINELSVKSIGSVILIELVMYAEASEPASLNIEISSASHTDKATAIIAIDSKLVRSDLSNAIVESAEIGEIE